MKLNVPVAPPPRDLEESRLTHGGRILVVTVLRQSSVSKRTGEVRYKPVTTTYAVEPAGPGAVRLVTERAGEDGRPVAYTVTSHGCDCPDAQFKGRERGCKHAEAVRTVGLLGTSGK